MLFPLLIFHIVDIHCSWIRNKLLICMKNKKAKIDVIPRKKCNKIISIKPPKYFFNNSSNHIDVKYLKKVALFTRDFPEEEQIEWYEKIACIIQNEDYYKKKRNYKDELINVIRYFAMLHQKECYFKEQDIPAISYNKISIFCLEETNFYEYKLYEWFMQKINIKEFF